MTNMQFSCNRIHQSKYVEQDGKKYLAVPVIALQEGVLNGELVTADEIGKFVESWNGIPLVTPTHPTLDNEHISAQDPEVLSKYGIGHFWRATFDGQKLRGEAWIDIDRVHSMDGDAKLALSNVESSIPTDVSTAYFRDSESVNGTFNGKEYETVAKNLRPDHLAILLYDQGACSWKDGCGIPRVNSLVDEAHDLVTKNDPQLIDVIKLNEILQVLSEEDAPSYRESSSDAKTCISCNFATTSGYCKLYDFKYNETFVCDSWIQKITLNKSLQDIDFQPTQEMASVAERALEWRNEYERGGTDVGVSRARDIKNRANLSPETVKRMWSFFSRHENNRAEHYDFEDGEPTAWRIAWDLWGGNPGYRWAERKIKEMENVQDNVSANVRSTARTPDYDGVEAISWANVDKSFASYMAGYYENTSATMPEEPITRVQDAPQEMKAWIASKTLLGDASADTVRDLIFFPVVNPNTNRLNGGAVRAVLSGRGEAANVPQSAIDSVQAVARRLLEDEFQENKSAVMNALNVLKNFILGKGEDDMSDCCNEKVAANQMEEMVQRLLEMELGFSEEELMAMPESALAKLLEMVAMESDVEVESEEEPAVEEDVQVEEDDKPEAKEDGGALSGLSDKIAQLEQAVSTLQEAMKAFTVVSNTAKDKLVKELVANEACELTEKMLSEMSEDALKALRANFSKTDLSLQANETVAANKEVVYKVRLAPSKKEA